MELHELSEQLIEEALCVSAESYVKSLGQPDLLDLVVLPTSEDTTMEDVEDLRSSKRKIIYSEVLILFCTLD